MALVDNFFAGIVTLATFIAAITGIIIWLKAADNKKGNRYLSLCLFASAITYSLYGSVYLIEPLSHRLPYLFYLPLATELLIFPPCYLYITSLFESFTRRSRHIIWLHLMPFIIVMGLVILLVATLSEEELVSIIVSWFSGNYMVALNHPNDFHTIILTVLPTILIIQIATYLYLVIKKQQQYHRKILDIYSDIEKIKFRWVNGIIIIWCLYLGIYLYYFFFPLQFNKAAYYLFLLFNVGFYLYIAVQALMHPFLFSEVIKDKDDSNVGKESARPKYQRSSMTDEQADTIAQKLLQHMRSEKPYLQPDLTINQLASQLELSRSSQLSQVFSQKMDEKFYQFVNRYRVEEAKKLLRQNPKKPVLDIALASGFKSVSTFYSHFKTIVGVTPSDFLMNKSID